MKLVLYGSGEFTAKVEDIDRYLIKTYDIKSVAVIPTAAGQEADVNKWFTLAEQHFKTLDIAVVRVPIFNRADADDSKLVALLDKTDWVFFSGGDPNYLLQTVSGTLLWDTVMKRYDSGTLLGGSSAGAMILGTSIMAHMFKALFTSENTSWVKAFGLVNYRIFPHFDRFKKHKLLVRRLVNGNKATGQSAWMGIDENTAILFDDEKQLILGRGTVEINPEIDQLN